MSPENEKKKKKPTAKPKVPATPKAEKAPPAVRRARTARPKAPKASPESLSILMVTPEAHPFAKTGGLAEVSAALPDALARLGHSVTLVLPRYRDVRVSDGERLQKTLRFGDRLQRPSQDHKQGALTNAGKIERGLE